MGNAPVRSRWYVGVSFAALLVLGACSADDEGASRDEGAPPTTATRPADQRGEAVAQPVVTGPVSGSAGAPHLAMTAELADEYGYVEDEFFLEGTATAYAPQGELGTDGEWAVTASTTAPYRTRIVVRRPTDPDAFDGTVFVEWLNVTGGLDNDPIFGLAHPAMMDPGSAYVAVSAQEVGVEGGGPAIAIEGAGDIPGLIQLDPERYGELDHPGDQYSYDMFSQAAQAVRRPGDVDVLDGLVATNVIAMGESQSAGRLVTYVNAVHPIADIYDGFLIHSRGRGGAALAPEGAAASGGVAIRPDMSDPVLQFETETDLFRLGFAEARQEDTEMLRTWEVTGTAHADQSILDYNVGLSQSFGLDLSDQCPVINDGPMAEVLRAAVAAMRTWVADGEPPAPAPPLEVEGGAIARDERGIALGGIRTPPVDAPVVVLSGEPVPGTSVLCSLFGNMTPLTPAELSALYPTHDAYLDAVSASAERAVTDGFLLEADSEAIVAEAQDAPVPG